MEVWNGGVEWRCRGAGAGAGAEEVQSCRGASAELQVQPQRMESGFCKNSLFLTVSNFFRNLQNCCST